jgi:hypothetical protein
MPMIRPLRILCGRPISERQCLTAFCVDIQPQIGITSTPVIDLDTNTIYVVAKTKNTGATPYQFQLHALDLITGSEKFGGPTKISGRVKGTGAGSSNGYVSFYALHHNNRPGLLLMHGNVYIAFGSTCDIPVWHGWVFAYDAWSLQQVGIYNTTPNGSAGGIWGAGQGLLGQSDAVYFITGNGTFDAQFSGADYGDSFVKLSTSTGLTVLDYFTPSNQDFLNSVDHDLGGGGPIALPGTNLIVGAGKDGKLRLVDTTNMGQFHQLYDADVQEFQAATNVYMGAPIYWNSPNNGPVIYMWGPFDYLKAYKLENGSFQTPPVSQSKIRGTPGYSNSAPLSLSADDGQAGSGIVWAASAYSGDANQQIVNGILRAFDATDLSTELWDSKQNAARDDVGNYVKFSPPTIVNGKVYLASFSNQLLVYGLLW